MMPVLLGHRAHGGGAVVDVRADDVVDALLRHLLHAGDGALGVLLIVEGDDLDVVGCVADLDAAGFVDPWPRGVCIERTLDVPQAAAGPLVTPTKPILSSLFAASLESAKPVTNAIAQAALSAIVLTTERLSCMDASLLK